MMHKESPYITESQIQYLPSLLSKLEKGDIRIPPFQRPFVWNESQVLELLESIYKGYPIGVLFFWIPEEEIRGSGWDNNFLLSNFSKEEYQAPEFWDRGRPTFILDGVQRLSSLYGVFNWKSDRVPGPFNIVFDLRNEKFLHYSRRNLPEAYISISALFTPKRFFEAQKQLTALEDSDTLIERTIRLHSKFQEYSIPVITVHGGALDNSIEIFERINTRGTQLTFTDLITGLFTTSAFNLNEIVEAIDIRLSQKGFQLSSELFIKTLAVILDKSPTPHDVLMLREFPATELIEASQTCEATLDRVVDFLKSEFNMFSFEVVPYEEQILVLAKLFSLSPSLSIETVGAIRRWFWRVSFSEGFRGKRTNYLMHFILKAHDMLRGDFDAFDSPLNLEASDFLKRNLARGKAFSLAVIAMMAAKSPRSLLTGEPIGPESFMKEVGLENFWDLFSRSVIQEVNDRKPRSSKLIANTIIILESEQNKIVNIAPRNLAGSLIDRFGDEAYAILESQFISPTTSKFILEDRPADFLIERAKELYEFAVFLSNES
jgi:hypothetical protein